jgi:hypothetical protein
MSTNNGTSWRTIISIASLLLALVVAAAGIVRHEINNIKEAAAADREQIRARLNQLSAGITPSGELNYRDQVLQAQINSLNERVDRLEREHRIK